MVGVVGESDSWYYVASGLKVEFAPWMPAGERLVSCKLPDGSDLDPNGAYKVAFMSDKLFCSDDGNISSLELADEVILEGKWGDIFPAWFADQGDGNNGNRMRKGVRIGTVNCSRFLCFFRSQCRKALATVLGTFLTLYLLNTKGGS